MKWAVAQGYREDNPASDAISASLPKNSVRRRHLRALPHSQVAEALARVRTSKAHRATAHAFEFLVLTTYRSGEVRGARWDEVEAASLGVGASAIRRWTSGRAPNFAAWYRASLVSNRKGPAAIGAARGWKLLSSPHASRVKPAGVLFRIDAHGTFRDGQVAPARKTHSRPAGLAPHGPPSSASPVEPLGAHPSARPPGAGPPPRPAGR